MDSDTLFCVSYFYHFLSISSEPQRCAQALALGTPKGAGCEAAFDAPAALQEEDEKAERQQRVFLVSFHLLALRQRFGSVLRLRCVKHRKENMDLENQWNKGAVEQICS